MVTTTSHMMSKTKKKRPARSSELGDALVLTLDRFFHGRPIWHGALWQHVADLTARQALWRPSPQRHCIWEIVRHIMFWRHWLVEHAAGRRVEDWKTHNWTLPESADAGAWQADLRRLRTGQRLLKGIFRAGGSTLLVKDAKGKFSRFWWVGVMAHDSYHTGQIALLRAMRG